MRRAIVVVAVAGLMALGACGGGDDPAAPDDGGEGGATSSAAPTGDASAAAVDPCDVLTVEEVGAVLGGAVTVKAVPGGGCGFDQDDLRAPSVGIFAVTGAGGGFDASKAGVVVDGEVEDVPGVGDAAWVAVGTSGGDNLQGQGIVALGDQLVNVTLTQGNGLDAAAVEDTTIGMLALIAGKG